MSVISRVGFLAVPVAPSAAPSVSPSASPSVPAPSSEAPKNDNMKPVPNPLAGRPVKHRYPGGGEWGPSSGEWGRVSLEPSPWVVPAGLAALLGLALLKNPQAGAAVLQGAGAVVLTSESVDALLVSPNAQWSNVGFVVGSENIR